jgi:hypothetical protein
MNLLGHGWAPCGCNWSWKCFGWIGENPYEPLQEEREKELALGETNTNKHLQVNETLVNYFGKWIDGKVIHGLGRTGTSNANFVDKKNTSSLHVLRSLI